MGKSGRFLLLPVVVSLTAVALRAAGGAIIVPLLLPIPMLALAYYRMKQSRRPMCPDCELPLSYRPLGPSHGMLECPSLCGYRRFVGSPPARP